VWGLRDHYWLVKDPICALRQGLGASTGRLKSKGYQGECKPRYRESIPNVIWRANSYG